MKKTTLLILFVCAFTLFLAACGKTPTDTTTSSSTLCSTTSESCTHAFSGWVVLKDPSCTEDGMRVQSCIYCQMGKFEPIAMTGHTEVIDQAVAPTCTKTGLTEGKRCSACNTVLVMQDLVSANGHTDANNDNFCEVCNDPVIACSQGLAYTLSDDGTHYILSGIGTCADTEIVIPSTYNSLPVKAIGELAFGWCESLTSITIPNNVTSIGARAFLSCINLTSITIPNSVTSIGDMAFGGCSSLTGITVEEGNPAYKSIDGNLYTIDEKTIVQYAIGKIDTSFDIPNGVTSIGCGAFACCESLTNITIPNSVTSIGEWAFDECYSLTSITIPNSVTSIGNMAFHYCTGLTSIAFETGCQLQSIGDWAFSNCYSLTGIAIPNSVTSIGDYAFSRSNISNIVIPEGVTSIGYGTFYGCTSLSSVTFENPNGWWYATSEDATSGTSLSAFDLADTAKATKYLCDTYSIYYWFRN